MSLSAIGIVCSNLEKTIEFYSLFDLEFKQEGGPQHYEALSSQGLRIMLDSVDLIKEINPDYVHKNHSNIVLCFEQSSPDLVNSLYEKVTSNGALAVKEPCNAFWGQRYASIKDPDGNQVDIFSNMQ